jgi:hypothetical protein
MVEEELEGPGLHELLVLLEVGDEMLPKVARHRSSPANGPPAPRRREPGTPDVRGGGRAYFKSLNERRAGAATVRLGAATARGGGGCRPTDYR